MIQYHGTSKTIADNLISGNIKVDVGGGELGKGFYTGNLLYKAFSRAHRYGKKNMAVVEFIFNDDDFLSYDINYLSFIASYLKYVEIAKKGKKEELFFNKDIIFASVVGDRTIIPYWEWKIKKLHKIVPCFSQIKFESNKAEKYLNSNKIIKKLHL